ncbi:major facilitator superfamily domain-containing protein 12 isoform X2 [Folsomia candida]|uniref:major facilitator superfamily domain-containing protein 12 isoform X2 n=1 Tax=Folsomia candida TaxID=158441 RepID=UPI0016052AE6|nr:major facilitator superfamily domain-containing protein 12 isoform X2 [Folsomia candida]
MSSNNRSILDLNFLQKISVASGHFINDITASIWFSYYLLYIQEVAGLSSDLGGGLMLLGQIVDAVSTPLVGYLADRAWGSGGCGFGRLKTCHLIGVAMAVISFPVIFCPPIGLGNNSSQTAIMAYYIPFIIIYEVSWAAVQISHLAYIPKTNPDMFVRTEILSIRYVLMVIANVIVFLVTWYSVGMEKNCTIDKGDVLVFQDLAAIAMGIGLLTALFFYITTKEYDDQDVRDAVIIWRREEAEKIQSNSSQQPTSSERTPLLNSEGQPQPQPRISSSNKRISLSTKNLNPGKPNMTTLDWVKSPQFFMVAVVYIPGRLIINVPQAFLPLYLQKTLHLPCKMLAICPLTYFLSGLLVATTMKKLAKWVGKQMSFGFGIVLNVVGASLILWGEWGEGSFLREAGIYGVFALLGGGASAGMVPAAGF